MATETRVSEQQPHGESDSHPFVSVIIPVFNDAERLAHCLNALEHQTYPADRYEVIVVDNASTEPLEVGVRRFAHVIFAQEQRRGSYAARNHGLSLARGSVLAFTDSDCVPTADWIERGVARLQALPACGWIGGKIAIFARDPRRPTAVELYERVTSLPQQAFVERDRFAATANMFTWRSVMEIVGPFNAALQSGGDREWGQRVVAAGYPVAYADEVVIGHPARASFRELYVKLERVHGGLRDLNHRHSLVTLAKDVARDVLFLRKPLTRTWNDQRLINVPEKTKATLMVLGMRYVRASIRLRHWFGASTVRATVRATDVPVQEDRSARRPVTTVAYLMSRFPKITETFILYEILELERLGLRVEVFPLMREHEQVVHPEAVAVVARAHYTRFPSLALVAAQFYWLRVQPVAYLRVWWHALWGNRASLDFLLRALMVVPVAARFAQQMQSLGVEHVHAHWATHPTLAAYVIRQLTGLGYSFTAHAHDIYVDRAMLAEKVRCAEHIVTISDYNRRLLADLYGPDALAKTSVIHCGIDPDVFQPLPPKPRDGLFTIVSVASLQAYKGHPYLIDACALIKAQGVPFRCLLVGEGEDRPAIEAQITRLGLKHDVLLLGRQPRNRVVELLAEADVVTFPSVTTPEGMSDGIPVAFMEAMAMQRPVIASALRSIPELVEDDRTGLLVPERDAPALADALLRLCRDPELGQRLAAAGRVRVLDDFNLRKTAAELHALLVYGRSASLERALVQASIPLARVDTMAEIA